MQGSNSFRGPRAIDDRPDRTGAVRARTDARQSAGSAGNFSSSLTSRSASAMSSSRWRWLRKVRKHFIKRRPMAVVSSAFRKASFGGIWTRSTADTPDLTP